MAITQSPNSKASVSARTDNKRKTMSSSFEEAEIKSEMKSEKLSSQPHKCNSNPGVRVTRGRIYDSQNGVTCHQGIMISSPKKSGKENLFDGKTNSNADPLLLVPPPAEKKPKKVKQKPLEIIQNDTMVNDQNGKNHKKLKTKEIAEENVVSIQQPQNEVETNTIIQNENATQKYTRPKKMKRKEVEIMQDNNVVSNHPLIQKKIKSKGAQEIVLELLNKLGGSTINYDQNTTHNLEDNNDQRLEVKKIDLNPFESGIPLPTGSELVTIAGVDLSKEDAGNALQLLEFCSTFGKILDVKKGQAEAVLRDLINGRSTRRGKYTSVIQFHIQLLSVIKEESGSESDSESESPVSDPTDSWLKALKNCISKSRLKHLECIDTSVAGYDNLDSSTKLKLLVFLCDEVVETEKIRKWIDEQNVMFAEKKKEAKDKLCAAKEKEKKLKQKMQDNIAKAMIANDGVPLTLIEHNRVVSKIKSKVAEAHAEMIACQEMVPIDKEKADAVRTDAIFRDNKGHIYWRLKGCSDKPGILLQDVGTGDHTVETVDKWFEFDDEQMVLIEKHIKILRSRFKKYYKN